jgi:putative transposase
MIDRDHPLPISKQARVLDIARSTVYYKPHGLSLKDIALMKAIDRIHTEHPFEVSPDGFGLFFRYRLS